MTIYLITFLKKKLSTRQRIIILLASKSKEKIYTKTSQLILMTISYYLLTTIEVVFLKNNLILKEKLKTFSLKKYG
jgi:hypothetical protein